MKPKHFRIMLAIFVLIGTGVTVGLTVLAFQQNMMFFYTPTQIANQEIKTGEVFRLGGLVEENSLVRSIGDLEIRFVITDTVNGVTVAYRGILPDLFREKQGVVVRGYLENGVVIAEEVLAKHDENYMPPEVDHALNIANSPKE